MKKTEMGALEIAEQFQLLRARVENLSEVTRSIFVSSALSGDGKDICAYGLAFEFEAAGYATLLIDLDYREPSMKTNGLMDLSHITSFDSLDGFLVAKAGRRSAMLSLTNTKLCMSASRGMVTKFMTTVLERFEKVIVLGPTLIASGVGLTFATECDGVIITTRQNRSVSQIDRALVETLTNESVKFLGVVSVAPNAGIEPLISGSPRYGNATDLSTSPIKGSQAARSSNLLL